MNTERLYEQDSHLRSFAAKVLSCQPGKHGYDVILDRSAFYPEGGGQPGDTGFLSGVRVSDTHEAGEELIHYCQEPLEVGQSVEGQIDWERRFSYMQLHSGEHILSGLIHARFGYENVGFHMGSAMTTIDFSGPLSWEELTRLEREANEVIWRDVPVQIDFPDKETLKTIPYRSKKELTGKVRIVTIPDADICACCGTHVAHTGEVGLIKIFSCQKFHDGVRLEILCGLPAYTYTARLIEQNRLNSAQLSAKPPETAAAVERLLEQLNQSKFRAGQLERQLVALRCEAQRGKDNVLLFESGLSADGLRLLADGLTGVCTGLCAVFTGSEESGWNYCLAQSNGDLRTLTKRMNQALNGRGGGKPGFTQGSVKASREQIQAFFDTEARL